MVKAWPGRFTSYLFYSGPVRTVVENLASTATWYPQRRNVEPVASLYTDCVTLAHSFVLETF